MELMDLANFFNELANYFVIVPLGVGFLYYKNTNALLKILLIGLSATLVQLLFFKFIKVNSSFFSAYVIATIDVVTFTIVFSETIRDKLIRTIFLIVGSLVLLFIPLDYLFITGLNNFGISTFIAKIFLLVTAFIISSQLFKVNLEDNLFTQPIIWICFGLILNSLIGSFDIFSVDVMSYSQSIVLQFYLIWAVIKIIMYLFFSYSFYLSKRFITENNIKQV